MNVIAYLSDTAIPVTLRQIVTTVPGYPESYDSARRAFERDKDTLRSMNFDVQVVSLPTGDTGYKIRKDNTYFDVELNAAQRSILQYALSMYSPNKDAAQGAVTKFGAGNPENEIQQIVSLSLPTNFDELFNRCNEKKPISIFFKDTWRHILPLRLIARDGYWYCESKDLEKDALRTFRLDRIEKISDGLIEASNTQSTSDDDSEEEKITIVLKTHPKLISQIVDEFGGVADYEKSHITVSLSRAEMLVSRIYEYAGFVAVIEPEELKKSIENSHKLLLLDLMEEK